jgi:thiol-disulfide isomerase/thioredoxin
MNKLKYTAITILIFGSLASQVNLDLAEIGNQRYSMHLGNGDNDLQTFSFVQNNIKLPSQINKQNPLFFTELSSKTLYNPNIKDEIYILIEKQDSLYYAYISSDKDDFSKSIKMPLVDNFIPLSFKSNKFNSDIGIIVYKVKNNPKKLDFYSSGVQGFDTTNINNWINFKYLSIKYGKYKINNDEIFIGFSDIYRDGELDLGQDLFFCSDKNYRFFYLGGTNKSTARVTDVNYIKYNKDTLIKVSNVDFKNGKCTVSLETITKQTKNYITYFNKLPENLSYTNIENQKIQVEDYLHKGKYLFIDLWTSYCNTCIKQFPIFDSLMQSSNKITIISLLEKDPDFEKLTELKDKYNIKHFIGWSNEILASELIDAGYPHGILFDDKGKLVDFLDLIGKEAVYEELIYKYLK